MQNDQFNSALQPVTALIDGLAEKTRGALLEGLVDEVCRARAETTSRKAAILDRIIAHTLNLAPLPSRVRAASKVARVADALPDAARSLACDVVIVAEIVLVAPDLDADLLIYVCEPERQDHMRIIARRSRLAPPVCDRIATVGDAETVTALVRNVNAVPSPAGYSVIADRFGADPTIRALVARRDDCPDDISGRLTDPREAVPVGAALTELVLQLAEAMKIEEISDLLMRVVNRDKEGGRRLIEREDEKALGAVCHAAGIDAETYGAIVEAWRQRDGRPMVDVRKAPVRFRLMRPVEIDRVMSRLPLARAIESLNRISA